MSAQTADRAKAAALTLNLTCGVLDAPAGMLAVTAVALVMAMAVRNDAACRALSVGRALVIFPFISLPVMVASDRLRSPGKALSVSGSPAACGCGIRARRPGAFT